jgi:DNA-binding transcriptional LysR family regulator
MTAAETPAALAPLPRAFGPGLLRDGPTLREFEVFRAVIDARKTTAAATRLGISQPAVSRALASLEERLGRLLFERDGGRLVPTAEALALNGELDPIFEGLARIAQRQWQSPPGETLRVAAPPTFAQTWVQPVLTAFLKLHPRLKALVEISSTNQVIVDSAVSHAGVRLLPLRSSRAICLLPAGHRLAGEAAIGPADLAEEPFIALTRRHSARSAIDRMFLDAGVEPRIVHETSTTLSAAEFVRAGLGVTLVNAFPIGALVGEGVRSRPFLPAITYQSSFVVDANLPPPEPARRFMRFCRLNVSDESFSAQP